MDSSGLVSINSTSYKRSDTRLDLGYDFGTVGGPEFPLIPLPIKEAIYSIGYYDKDGYNSFPLIPLPIKEAILT